MTRFTDPVTDAVAGATPLAVIKAGGEYDLMSMFIGKIPGTIGEVSVIALLIGAAYLLVRKVISILDPRYIYPDLRCVRIYLRTPGHGLCAG